MSSSVSAGISSSEFDKLCYEFEGALILDDSGDINCDAEARYFGPTSGRLELPVAQDEPEHLVKTPKKPFVRDISMLNAYIVDDSLMQFQDLYLPVQPSPSITPPSLTSHSPAAPTPETFTSDELQSHLVDLYFAWDNPWHNILNEGRFRYAMKHNTKCFSPVLLNSVLAMGSRYSDRIDVRSDPADGNTAGRPYLEVAEKLLQKELQHPRIATVQSLAIMGVLYAAMGRDACGYLHQGMANRLALDMGLNIDPITLTGSQSILPYIRDAFAPCWTLKPVTWYYALPAELKVERIGNNNYPAAYMLGMLYHTSVILLAKPFLKALDSTNPTTDNFQANNSSPSPQLSNQEREAMHLKAKVLCDEAAKEICVLGAKYRKVFGSFRKCPPTANHSILQAALVTLQTHTLADDPANKRGKLSLENYLQTLKELSQSWSPPRRYWSSVSRLVQARLSAATGAASTALLYTTEDANATQHGEGMPANEFMAAHEPPYNGDDAEMIQSWIGAFYEEGGLEAYLNSGPGDTADDHHMFMDVLHEMGRESNTTDSSRDSHQ
ncbi:Nitrogen assimilation transcription factor nirA like protein [Verticillium longisporum]|uniref:Nitrogen assimilation transcription factor nirA like protein n=1 Tax=Verticillium longisporum TaxID=100787 RepID=A0A8I2ZFQ7_VERLO|nr:Nitrogen assimilation transcription factor nirA like protein [Verticillium longisporum]